MKCQHCMLANRPATHRLTGEGGNWHYVRDGQVSICKICVEHQEQKWLHEYGAREKPLVKGGGEINE